MKENIEPEMFSLIMNELANYLGLMEVIDEGNN
jgi:hypothetical protein